MKGRKAEPFMYRGRWFDPVAVALYGDLRDCSPLDYVVDPGEQPAETHVVLYAERSELRKVTP